MTGNPEGILPRLETIDVELSAESRPLPAFERALLPQPRDFRLLTSPPWVRGLGKLTMEIGTLGWKFPTPLEPKDAGGRREEERKEGRCPVDPESLIPHPSSLPG